MTPTRLSQSPLWRWSAQFYERAAIEAWSKGTVPWRLTNSVRVAEEKFRAPHILSLGFDGGMPAGLVEGLASEGIYVAPRLGRMRVSPHVYNDELDVERFVSALRRRLKS